VFSFNFFDNDILLDSFCKLYNLDKNIAEPIIFEAATNFDCALFFIKKTGLQIDSISVNDVFLHCKHITTINDDFQSLKRYGLISANEALTVDTPLKHFLDSHNIRIDIANKTFTYKEITIYLHQYKEDCISCHYGECKHHRLDWDGKLDIDHKNCCVFRQKTLPLSLKLYSDKGEIEVHLAGNIKKVHDYSCVKYYPEILITIGNLISEIFNERKTLGQDWHNRQQGKYYCLSFDVNISDFEYKTSRPIFDEHYYAPYFEFCKNPISSLSFANKNFYANIYLITKSIGAISDTLSDEYGQLLPHIKIPYEKMTIQEFNY